MCGSTSFFQQKKGMGFFPSSYLVNLPSTKVEGFQHCVLKKAQKLL